MLILLLFIIFYCTPVSSQTYIYQYSFGKFISASSFHISAAGFIYLTDAGNNQVFKMDTLGVQLKESGGYGWQDGTFDYPSNVFATPLNIYVADKNNHKIQRFDKDLNFISTLFTRDNDDPNSRFGYPLACVISNQGDLFILDSENRRIVKFDLFGNFIQNFGGYDYAKYALNSPVSMASDMNNNLYVADGKNIIIYDQFGTGAGEINTPEVISSINIIFSNMTFNSKENVYFYDLERRTNPPEKLLIDSNEFSGDIKGSFIFNSKLYILTSKEILVFQRH